MTVNHRVVAAGEHRNFEAELATLAHIRSTAASFFPRVADVRDESVDVPEFDLKGLSRRSPRTHTSPRLVEESSARTGTERNPVGSVVIAGTTYHPVNAAPGVSLLEFQFGLTTRPKSRQRPMLRS